MLRAIVFYISIISSTFLFGQESDSLKRQSIYFGGGSYYIDEEQLLKLQEFFSQVENLNEYEIVLFSHTDNIGGKEYNEWLSMKRSSAVINHIKSLGIPEELTKVKNLGMDNPLYTNRTSNGRMMNRRVDVILVPITF